MTTWQRFAVGTAIASFLALTNMARFGQMQPRMMGDELTYSQNVLLRPMAEITHPNFLYQLVYQPVVACGDNFYLCTKWINTGFLLLFAGTIYLIATRFGRRLWAALIAVAIAIGPVAIYSSFFTPDMMFFALAALTIWAYVRQPLQYPLANWQLVGSLLSLSLLTKPHAVVLVPALVVTELLTKQQDAWRNRLRAAIAPTAVGAAAMLTKLAVGFLAAGTAGLGIFGGRYERAVGETVQNAGGGSGGGETGANNPNPVAEFISQYVLHIGFAAVFFGVVLVIAVRIVRRESGEANRLAGVLISTLVFGAFLSALFVAIAPSWGETLDGQVMVRYYEYAIWLLPVLALASLGANRDAVASKKVSAFVLASAVFAGFWLVTNSRPLFTDGSLLGTVGGLGTWLLVVFALAGLALVAFSLFSKADLAQLWLVAVLPLITVAGWLGAQQLVINPGLQTNPYIESAVWVRENLRPDEYQRIVLVGPDQRLVQTAQFWIRDLDAIGFVRERGAVVNPDQAPKNTLLVLIDGVLAGDQVPLTEIHRDQYFMILEKR